MSNSKGNEDDEAGEPDGSEPETAPAESDVVTESVVERTREAAEARREKASRRYERAAARGRKGRRRRRRRRDREEALAGAVRRLHRLPLEPVLETSLVIALSGSVLALGGLHAPVIAVLSVVSAVALATALALRDETSPRLVGPAMVCWALSAWCLLQMVPLPSSWLEVIAPTNADIWQRALIPFGEAGPTSAPISLDPGASAIEAARWFSYGAIFVAAAQVSAKRGARWVLTVMFLVAMVTALVTLGHGMSGMKKVYGFYEPTFKPSTWHVGPLLNGNNLSGLLNLGAMCGLGLMLADRREGSPWLIVTGVALIVGVDVISASRGGVALLLVGVVLLAITVELPNRRRSQEAPVGRARFMVAATLALGVALALLGGRSALWNELLDENMEKLRLVGAVEPAIGDFRWTGMGRGSFESVFAAYQQDSGGVVFTHAENFVMQWVVEWGAPAALLALLALGFFLRPRRMGVRRSSLAAAAWLGVLVVLAQNLVDLGLEVPGLCFALATTLGALWGDADLFREPARKHVSRRRHLVLAGAALAAGVALGIGGYALGRHGVAAERHALREQLISATPPRSPEQVDALHRGLRAAMLRHPAEPYFSLLGAELDWEEGTGRAIPWLQRTLERSAVNGRAHLLLARVLWRHGARYQALLELRLAGEAEFALVGHAAKDAAAWTSKLDDLARAAPHGDRAAHFWQAVAHYAKDRTLGAACDRRALALDPSMLASRHRLVEDVIGKRESGRGCLGDEADACSAEVEEHAAAVAAASPSSSLATRLRARWLAAIGQPTEAEQLLAEACETAEDTTACLRARAEVASQLKGAEPFGEAAKALRRSACAKRDDCGKINMWLGGKHMARKEHALAVTAFEKAVRENPTNDRLNALATAAVAAGLSSRALRALERLIERTDDPAKKRELQGRKRAVMERMLR